MGPGHRHDRRRGVRERQAGEAAELVGGLQCAAHVHHAGPWHQHPDRLADDAQREQQPVRHLAVHQRPAHDGAVQLHDPGARRDLPLAVHHPVRRRLPGRERRPDVDRGLHERADGGSGLMTAETAPDQEPNHGARLLSMWLLLSASCDPLFWFLAGPHIPPGRMSSSAATQQTDFNILALIAIPVVIGVLLYFGYALTYWRGEDGGGTDGPPPPRQDTNPVGRMGVFTPPLACLS